MYVDQYQKINVCYDNKTERAIFGLLQSQPAEGPLIPPVGGSRMLRGFMLGRVKIFWARADV